MDIRPESVKTGFGLFFCDNGTAKTSEIRTTLGQEQESCEPGGASVIEGEVVSGEG